MSEELTTEETGSRLTKYLWIYENQIAGDADGEIPEEDWADGFKLVSAPADLPIDTLYWDGSAVQIKPEQPSPLHYWDSSANEWLAPFVPEPKVLPKWDAFFSVFQMPGNLLYRSVAQKVAQSDFETQDHWANFKMLLSTPTLRSVETLAASIEYLEQLLTAAGHPLSASDKTVWNGLMQGHDFPESCWLD